MSNEELKGNKKPRPKAGLRKINIITGFKVLSYPGKPLQLPSFHQSRKGYQ